MISKRVLIVEDEITQLTIFEKLVARAGFDVETATDGKQAVARITDTGKPDLDVVLLDFIMPGMNGIDVLRRIRPTHPNLPVVMLTAHSSVDTIVDAMRAGANDFIVKPASADRIKTALENAITAAELVGDIAPMMAPGETRSLENLVGSSGAMRNATQLATKAASATIPVLIDGESGVGKEVFARAIHSASARADKPFVAVNCGAIPENLVESILFGHEKGAFTGASEKRAGKFIEAEGGTLFLDEVGELPLDIQVKLLRALQEKEIEPVGSAKSVRVDIRIISATNRNLMDLVAGGTFREDLFYRLHVFPLTLPPLRDRREDIPALVDHFVHQVAKMENQPLKSVPRTVMDALMRYDWPGNIRQLQNMIFRAIVLSDGEELSLIDFPHLTAMKGVEAIAEGTPAPAPSVADITSTTADITIFEGENIRTLAAIESDIIKTALDHYDGHMSKVAKALGIGRSTLYRKVEEYGLSD